MGGCSNHSCRYDLICNEGGSDQKMPYTCVQDTQCQWNDGCTACLQGSGQTIQANTPNYVAVGCYHAPNTNTGFNNYVNLRSQINWHDIGATIRACALEAKNRMLLYFGIEFYGECYMRNDTLEASYRLVSASKCTERCVLGVGAQHTLFVYQLQ
ncbi:uncharacterized protein LOC133185646 [Saccostrea echinata]|nr:uncharacterized protein LOC133185646 [Saccostrea echinata]